MTLYLSACFNTVATYIAILLCVTQDDCAKLVFESWAQTAEYGFGAPEIYFITIFGAPKVHYIIILNSLDCPDLLQELPFVYHFEQIYHPLATPRLFLCPCPENGHTLQSGAGSVEMEILYCATEISAAQCSCTLCVV